MGTRGLLGFKLDGKTHATYNHEGSYPGELGITIVDFCACIDARHDGWAVFRTRVRKLKWIPVEESDDKPSAWFLKKYAKFRMIGCYGEKVIEDPDHVFYSNAIQNTWYWLLRGTQDGRCLEQIYTGRLGHMIDYTTSEKIRSSARIRSDIVWTYIIDFDLMRLEVYEGFMDRFAASFSLHYLPDSVTDLENMLSDSPASTANCPIANR